MSKPFNFIIYSIITFFGFGFSTGFVDDGVVVLCFTGVAVFAGCVVVGFGFGVVVAAPEVDGVLETGGLTTAGLCSIVGGGTSLY